MRILTFAIVVLIGFLAPWWVLSVAASLYAFRYDARELLLLGFILDLSYAAGAVSAPIFYTLGALVLITLMAVIKPRLTFFSHASF